MEEAVERLEEQGRQRQITDLHNRSLSLAISMLIDEHLYISSIPFILSLISVAGSASTVFLPIKRMFDQ